MLRPYKELCKVPCGKLTPADCLVISITTTVADMRRMAATFHRALNINDREAQRVMNFYDIKIHGMVHGISTWLIYNTDDWEDFDIWRTGIENEYNFLVKGHNYEAQRRLEEEEQTRNTIQGE